MYPGKGQGMRSENPKEMFFRLRGQMYNHFAAKMYVGMGKALQQQARMYQN